MRLNEMPNAGNTAVEQEGIALVKSISTRPLKKSGLGSIFRETSMPDYGIDGYLEFLSSDERGNSRATGKLISVQVKTGQSYFAEDDGDSWRVYIRKSTVNYWMSLSIPVILILVNEEQERCYWVRGDAFHEETMDSFRIQVPKANIFNSSARKPLFDIAVCGAPGKDITRHRPKDLHPDLDVLLSAIWQDDSARRSVVISLSQDELQLLRFLTANMSRSFSLDEISQQSDISQGNVLSLEVFMRIKEELEDYHHKTPEHSHYLALYMDNDPLGHPAFPHREHKGVGIYLFNRSGCMVPRIPPIQNPYLLSGLVRWPGSPFRRDIYLSWKAGGDSGFALPIEETNVFLRCDRKYTCPILRDVLMKTFEGKYAGKYIADLPIVRLEDAFERGGESFGGLTIPGKYSDFGCTNKLLYEPLDIRHSPGRPLWENMGHTPQQAFWHTANPLALNVMIILKPSNEFVINVRGERSVENWNTFGPSLSGSINADPYTGRFLCELTSTERQGFAGVVPDGEIVRKIDLREIAQDMARQELGAPVADAMRHARIYVTGYGFGLKHGTGALLAHCTIDLTRAQVIASLSSSNRWETQNVTFLERSFDACYRYFDEAKGLRPLPFLDFGMMMSFYPEYGPRLFEISSSDNRG